MRSKSEQSGIKKLPNDCLSIQVEEGPHLMAQFAKTDIRYWRDKVFLPQYTRNGERHTSRHYSIRIRYKGERESFSLYTPNQVAAAAKARDIYLTLTTQGWAAARARFKAEGAPAKAADNLT